jgi:hypothetical protein
MKSKLAFLALVAVCLCGRAQADSTATATVTLDWANTTFSSPASPHPLPNNSYSTVVQASGFIDYPVAESTTFQGKAVTAMEWAPTTFTEQFSVGNAATASTDAMSIRTTATNTVGSVGTSMNAQAERSGAITTLDGNLVISVPYTFTFTTSNGPPCCSLMVDQVFIELFSPTTSPVALGTSALDFSSQSFSQSGTEVLNATGLAPGTYFFDVGAASQSTFVPEPGTLGLVGLGFVLIWRRLNNRARMAGRI